MAEEQVATAAAEITINPSPATDLKRKHPESEEELTVTQTQTIQIEEEEEEESIDAKRPRLYDDVDVKEREKEILVSLVSENGSQEDKNTEPIKEEEDEPSKENITEPEAPQQTTEEAPEKVDGEQQPSTDDQQVEKNEENPSQLENESQKPSETDVVEGEPNASENEGMSRKMEVPNDKVGVLIGKGGETIRYLQINSGAKIQIMRDADIEPHSTKRPVELIGQLENINKAEKLIKDVIAEAEAGGSPALVARGFSTAQAAGSGDQVLIQVPNEKVGVIIGKGGDTIKNLQTRSGARIQLIPQHLPEGDQSKERTVRVSGDKRQIEKAREMIKEVMNQPPRQPSSGGYNQQQSFHPRGPSPQQQWGSQGPNKPHPSSYNDYQQRGPYPSQNSQYQQSHGYNNYPPQSGPRSNYGRPGWGEQRPPTMPGPAQQGGGGGYDYYSGQGQMGPPSNPHQAHGPGPNHSNMGPPSHNYGPSGSYPSQGYSQGYGENRAPGYQQLQHPHGNLPPAHGVPPQHGLLAQNYNQPRPSQPGDMPPQQQPYGQNAAPPQQSYPYPQNYSSYGPAEGYNQPQPTPGSTQMYPQQSGQHGPGYGQAAGYGSYPAQQGYGSDQTAQNNAGYGYQGGAEPAYGGAAGYGGPPAGQTGYTQVPVQPGYDPTAQNPGAYGVVPAGYGKGVSPQPGYDATQMYGAAPAPAPR